MLSLRRYIVTSFLCFSTLAFAGEADVVEVKHECIERVCSFSVTVLHADEGWDHYADRWDVFDQDGNILGTRILHHPHENEQPFTRSLSGVSIPEDVDTVVIKAGDSVHEYGGKTVTITLF